LTAHNDEFTVAFLESMDQAIRSLLSQEVVDAFHSNLRDRLSIGPEEIPNQLPTISIMLRKYFGPSAQTIENTIAQELYSKYGLEYQKNRYHQLTDYVEDARNKLRSVTPTSEAKDVNLPLRGDLDRLLVESVKEAIEDVLGTDSAKLAFRFLERDVTFDKLPRHLPTFYAALKKNFGEDYPTIEKAIAKKLYLKLSLEFTETPNIELARYIEEAYVKLSQREQQGFINISHKQKGG
jgi:hypothetical protein